MKPEDRIVAYLYANRSKFEYSTMDIVISAVKMDVFFFNSPLSDADIRKVVSQWAMFNAPGLIIGQPNITGGVGAPPATPPAAPNTDSQFIDAVKKAVTSVTDGVTIGKQGANINLGVKGVTANLKGGDSSVALSLSWTGSVKLQAESGPFHFEGNLSKDSWDMTLSFPKDSYIPDMSSLSKVFSEGERAIGKIAAATQSFSNITDVSKVSAMVKPYVSSVQDAVEAVSGIADADKKGGPSFGFKLQSPPALPGQQGIPGGVQGSVVLTWVF